MKLRGTIFDPPPPLPPVGLAHQSISLRLVIPSLPQQVQAGPTGSWPTTHIFIYIGATLKDDPGDTANHCSCNRILGKLAIAPLRALSILIKAIRKPGARDLKPNDSRASAGNVMHRGAAETSDFPGLHHCAPTCTRMLSVYLHF